VRTREQDYALLVELLKASRKESGLSQTELADRLDDTQSFVSKVERGDRRLDVVELIEFCEALGISVEQWLKEYVKKRAKHWQVDGLKIKPAR
jgi:transcriptional regulator with XRE-family HTH domain